MKRTIVIIFFVVGCAAFAVIKSILNFKASEDSMAIFNEFAPAYIDSTYSEPTDAPPYLSGKIVTIDVKEKKADYWTFPKLPLEIKATSPSEVGTIALIEWEKKRIGHYENEETHQDAGEAFQAIGNVILVDWNEKRIIDKKTFIGDKPVTAKRNDDDYMAWWPMFDVVEYLKKLPRR